jgi:UDP-N-acetylmuramoyl-tripeptide--D-alanyl-D-alanine ligase
VAETPLWTIAELQAATGGRYEGRMPAGDFHGVTIDSRSIAPADIFVAIKGDRLDGHDFATAALTAGAGVAIVSRPDDAMRAAGAVLVVADPLRALEDMGRASRERSSAKIIGVTGSVGKTSTKEALRAALGASGHTHASVASFNNHWGVPLTLARMPRETAYGVFEIGMNHAGEIAQLVKMVRPHIAVITTIAASHLGHFNSLDDIADAKAEIFLGVERGGHAVINRDTPYFDRLAAAAREAGISSIVGFGKHDGSAVWLERLVMHDDCSCITAKVMGETVIYKLGMPGEHMAINSLGVLAAVKLAGADLARAALSLAVAAPAKGRGVRTRLKLRDGEALLIDESYNSNPASVRAALRLLGQAKPGKGGRRIAVLGDMLELGVHGPALHAELAEPVDAAHVDVLYASGKLMENLWAKTPAARRGAYAETSDGLRDLVVSSLRAGDVVMIKGSLGSRMGPIAEALMAAYPAADKDT